MVILGNNFEHVFVVWWILMKIYVKFHENHVKIHENHVKFHENSCKISWKMWSEAEIDHIFHEICIDFKPIYLGVELKG
jgi:hypothetical protein